MTYFCSHITEIGSKKYEDHPVVAGLESKCNRGLSETGILWSNGNVECTNIAGLFYFFSFDSIVI